MSQGDATAASVVEDLFLTETFLIKGRLRHKAHRLAKILEDLDRRFLTIEDAELVALRGGETIRTPRVMVHRREIILAHEFVDFAGDLTQRTLAGERQMTRIRAFFNGQVQLEIAGKVERGAYDSSASDHRRFFVVREPVIRGLAADGEDALKPLQKMGYAIVQKDRLSYVYDFG